MSKSIISLAAAALIGCALPLNAQERDYDLEEVVVTASKMNLPLKNIPQKVEVIDRELIQTIPAETLAELLKKVTALDIIQYPGTSAAVGLRGYAPSAHNRNYTIVLLDGKPAGTTNLAAMPTEFVERIEVVKGPYSVLYGSDAMGGVINIITRRPSGHYEGGGSVGFGSFGSNRYSGYASGRLGRRVRASLGWAGMEQNRDYKIGSLNMIPLSETERDILDEKSYGDAMDHSRRSMNQYIGMLDVDLSRRWTLLTTAHWVTSEGIEMPGNYWHSYGKTTEDFSRFNLSIDLKRTTRRNALTFSPYYTDYLEKNYPFSSGSEDNFVSDKNRTRQVGFKLYDTQKWGAFSLLGGIDLDAFLVSSERFSDATTPDAPFRPDYNSLSLSGYLQGAYTLDRLFLNAGVRYTFSRLAIRPNDILGNEGRSDVYSNVSPSFGVKYFVLPSLALHGSLGTAFYLPDAYQKAGQFSAGGYNYRGNPDLKTETSFAYDLGVNFHPGRIFNLDLTYFQTFYQNKVITDYSNPEYTTYVNADNGRISGLEVMLSADLAALFDSRQTLELYANYTRLFTDEFDAKNGGETVTKALIGVREETGSFGIYYNDGRRFSARLNARLLGHKLENDWFAWTPELRPGITAEDYYEGEGYTAADQILRHPKHLVFDLGSDFRLTRSLTVGLSVSNLFDENYAEKDGYNMPGRLVMGTATYTF